MVETLLMFVVRSEEQGVWFGLVRPGVEQRRYPMVRQMLVHSWVTQVRVRRRVWCELKMTTARVEQFKTVLFVSYFFLLYCIHIFLFIISF